MKGAARVVSAGELAGILRVDPAEVTQLEAAGVLVGDGQGGFPLLRNLQAYVLLRQAQGRASLCEPGMRAR